MGDGSDISNAFTQRGLSRIVTTHTKVSSKAISTLGIENYAQTYAMTLVPPSLHIPVGGRGRGPKKAARKGAAKKAASNSRTATAQEQQKKIARSYWTRVKDEIRTLFCTNDKRYEKIRKAATSKHTQTTLVSMISAVIASELGVAAGAVITLVALAIQAALQVGVNAYCAGS